MASQEDLLQDYVRRLEKHKAGRRAAYLRLSGLRPFNRRPHHIRIAAENFDALVKDVKGQLFSLKNADLLFVYLNEVQNDVEVAVQKIRYLFSDDPLLTREERGAEKFVTWFDVEADFDAILQLTRDLTREPKETETAGGDETRTAIQERQAKGVALTPEVLTRVESALSRADLSNLVRRQYVCAVTAKDVPEPAFSELFISIHDLRQTLLPGVNLAANRWLFQHLTQTLDRRMLSMLSKTDQITFSGEVSFNMNVATILSPEFLAFDDSITASQRGALIVEIDKTDIFADLGAFLFARNFVRQRGYQICIDGMTHQTLPLLDRERLGADFIKLVWDPEMVDGGEAMKDRIHAMVQRAGQSRVVLCRCGDREAIDFGHSIGIQFFQGRHIENLIAEDNRRRELLKLKRRIERS